MRLPALFRKERTEVQRQAQDRAEKMFAQTLRRLGQLCGRLADYVDSQRLSRAGYEDQGRYLERLDDAGATKPEKH